MADSGRRPKTPHIEHASSQMTELGRIIEEALLFQGKRGHFILLTSVDGVVHSISNTARPDQIEILRWHADIIEQDQLIPGTFKGVN